MSKKSKILLTDTGESTRSILLYSLRPHENILESQVYKILKKQALLGKK